CCSSTVSSVFFGSRGYWKSQAVSASRHRSVVGRQPWKKRRRRVRRGCCSACHCLMRYLITFTRADPLAAIAAQQRQPRASEEVPAGATASLTSLSGGVAPAGRSSARERELWRPLQCLQHHAIALGEPAQGIDTLGGLIGVEVTAQAYGAKADRRFLGDSQRAAEIQIPFRRNSGTT